MLVSRRKIGDHLLLKPQQSLLADGSADAFGIELRQMIRDGYHHLIIDFEAVPSIDSAAIRVLVRAHTSVNRSGGSLRLAAMAPGVKRVLELSHLASVFDIYDSVHAAELASIPWKKIAVTSAGIVLCGGLVWLGLRYPFELAEVPNPASALTDGGADGAGRNLSSPFIELGKLVAALLIGMLVTTVHTPSSREGGGSRSMAQAQTLLCVSGAMMMIIIGNSLARAFGIAGAASIIRFRTPVDDPKDVTILFLLMGLGMSTGLGALAVAGLGTAFLCLALLGLEQFSRRQDRLMAVEIVSDGPKFPTAHVEKVFLRNHVSFEPREITHGEDVTVKYNTWVDPRGSLEDISAQLMESGTGVAAVSWDHPKRA